MILVTGATGNFGCAAVDFLLGKIPADNIAALVRDEKKCGALRAKGVSVRIGDYGDYPSLVKAMKGIGKLLLVSGNDVMNREKHHKNVIDAAKEAGVKHVIYTSFLRKNETESNPLGIVGMSHINTDRHLKESGLGYTILLNSLYAEVLPMFFGEEVPQKNIYLPAGDGKVAYAMREEMAEVAARVLLDDGHENKEYVVANIRNYNLHDVAAYLSEITGQKINYISPDVEEYKQALSEAGISDENIAALTSFCNAIAQGEFETSDTVMEKLLGRTPTSLKEFLIMTYGSDRGRVGTPGF